LVSLNWIHVSAEPDRLSQNGRKIDKVIIDGRTISSRTDA